MSEHQRLVCKLYKQAINTTKDWVHDRRAYRIYALCIRAAFDRRKEETNTEKIESIVAATKKILLHWKHDNPIVFPLSPGGVMADRGPRFSQELLEAGHRQVWGANWQEEMRKYEESLLYDKTQTYFNTPIIDYDKGQQTVAPGNEEEKR